MADFNIKVISSLASGVDSSIIALDPARNRDIAATVCAGAIPAAATVTIKLIQCSGSALQDKTAGKEDPATVFADQQRIYTKTYTSPDGNIWSLGEVLLGRFSHMIINQNGGSAQTFTVLF